VNRKVHCLLSLNPVIASHYAEVEKMKRNCLVAALVLMLSMVVAPGAVFASIFAEPTPQELVLLKKKKKQAAAAKAKQEAEWKRAAIARRKAAEKRRAARGECDGFLACLFGQSRGDGRIVSGRPTARNISWEETRYPPGSIIIRTPERALYLVLEDGRARRYRVGVGREGFQWSGSSSVVAKQEWPSWRPPQQMIVREAERGVIIPEYMEGGPDNPLGARALYIGGTLYRIHGTNNAGSIGGAVSSGCIRMMNPDVIDLYERVNIGARVYVYQ
jgi:lipoprotein-anchoring transpeptidase ErfK/SrfK